MEPTSARPRQPPSSRQRYHAFLAAYRAGRRAADGPPAADGPGTPPRAGRGAALRAYARWLVPFRGAVAVFLVLALLALLAAALQMVEPLFLRHIVDRVLLVPGLEASERLARLHAAGAAFLAAVVSSNLLNALEDYRLMKTGGILSRLTGDVDTISGMLQVAVVSPTLAVVRLAVACPILVALDWRLALTAFALVPGIVVVSVFFARRVRPIYRSVREDAERVDGRVGRRSAGSAWCARSGRRRASGSTSCAGATPCCARSCSRSGASWCCGRRGASSSPA